MIQIAQKADSLMVRFLLAGSDTLHPRSRSMSRSESLLWTAAQRTRKYAIAVLSVTAALILSQITALHLEAAPASLLYCAVMLGGWFGGFGPGYIATALSTLAFYYYILPPIHSLAAKPEEIPRLLVFAGVAFLAATLSAAQRRTAESLRRSRDELLVTVQKLQTTNDALQAESRERKQAEEKLRRSESYLAEAQRLSHTGSWASRPATGEILYFSEECYRVVCLDPDGGPPRYETFLRRVHPDDRARLNEAVERAGRENTDFELDYRIVHPDGEIRDIHVIGHPVPDASSGPVQYVGTVIDVTERKQAEEEREKLRQARADLARASRVTTMGELSASLAHEIKQPIAAAITDANTCVRWLARGEPDPEEARAAAPHMGKGAIQ